MSVLIPLLVNDAYWGPDGHNSVIALAVERIANVPYPTGSSRDAWVKFRRYPALLALYAAGTTAVAAQKYELLHSLLFGVEVRELSKKEPAYAALTPRRVFDDPVAQLLWGKETLHTPQSDWLHAELRPFLTSIVPDDEYFDRAFDRFEFIWNLTALNVGSVLTLGRYAWRISAGRSDVHTSIQLEQQGLRLQWPLLKFFGGSEDSFKATYEKLLRHLGTQFYY